MAMFNVYFYFFFRFLKLMRIMVGGEKSQWCFYYHNTNNIT